MANGTSLRLVMATGGTSRSIMERRMIASFSSRMGGKRMMPTASRFVWNRGLAPVSSLLPSCAVCGTVYTNAGSRPCVVGETVRFASSASPAEAAASSAVNDFVEDDYDDDDDDDDHEQDETEKEKVNLDEGTKDDGSTNDASDKSSVSEENEQEKPLTAEEFDPIRVINDICCAARWNQIGHINEAEEEEEEEQQEEQNVPEQDAKDKAPARKLDGKKWNPEFVRYAVHEYERHLRFIQEALEKLDSQQEQKEEQEKRPLEMALQQGGVSSTERVAATFELLSSNVTARALKASIKMNIPPYGLSVKVRTLERLVGQIGMTPLTDELSFRLLEANGKAGNVGRSLALLNLRKGRQYPPLQVEFMFAITSLESASLYLKDHRNIYMGDFEQPHIDNPTRWLDAILINMSSRGFPLNHRLANRMLNCFASTGRTGRAVHFFYRVVEREKVAEEEEEEEEEDYANEGDVHFDEQDILHDDAAAPPTFPRMEMMDLPPFEKVPSQVKGKLVFSRRTGKHVTKLARESERDWSIPLTAAFAFADSLSHGACGHEPHKLNLVAYNTLIKICCYRGALWRALRLLNEVMPRQGIEPDVFSYNTVLSGLARVGDCETSMELFQTMQNKQVPIDNLTVAAVTDGMLNVGDVGGAITFVQDAFNRYLLVSPQTTHWRILEFALAQDLVYEAKRHVHVIQQIMKWSADDYPHTPPNIQERIRLFQVNRKLSKQALMDIFAHFGEELSEEEFW